MSLLFGFVDACKYRFWRATAAFSQSGRLTVENNCTAMSTLRTKSIVAVCQGQGVNLICTASMQSTASA